MKIEKKYIIAGGLAIISVGLAYGYLQYKKLMDYCLSFKSVRIRKVSLQNIDFDIFLNFTNKSDNDLTIKSQTYDVYLNDIPLALLTNNAPTLLKKNGVSTIGLNVKIDDIASKIKGNDWLGVLAKGLQNKLVVDIKMNIKFMFLSIPIKYKYEAKLLDLAKPSESAENKCK